jgi:hypothetical protein
VPGTGLQRGDEAPVIMDRCKATPFGMAFFALMKASDTVDAPQRRNLQDNKEKEGFFLMT